MIHHRLLLSIIVVVLSAFLIACEGSSDSGGSPSTYTPGQKVSANNASEEDLKAAFQHAQISNADKWAKEVEEYRPYPEDDPGFAKLRGELAKYNPTPGVVDQIIDQLELP